MNPSFLEGLILILLGVFFTLSLGGYKTISKKCERMTYIEAKMDIYLAHAGFDNLKVDQAIKNHKDGIEENGRPTAGCIDISKLYKE